MASQKRQELPKKTGKAGGVLFVVATPIGNLEDLTPRARRVLGQVDGVLCEDTRMTAKLLKAAGVEREDGGSFEGRLGRFDQHASEGRLDGVVERLASGENLALVSDAGTPAISDPGAELVARVREAGFTVVPIPGASALTAFLAGAGFVEGTPVFRGFYPRKASERAAEIAALERLPFGAVAVWFESPERIREAVESLAERLPEARATAAKELTKLHERFYSDYLKNLVSHIHRADADGEIRGEWVIGVAFPARPESTEEDGGVWEKALICLINSGISASRAAREVSQVFGISRNAVYARAVALANTRD